MKKFFNVKTLLKLVFGGGIGWFGSELVTSLLSALHLITPEAVQNSSWLQIIFTVAKNLLGGSVSLQPLVQWIFTLLGALGPVGGKIRKILTNKK